MQAHSKECTALEACVAGRCSHHHQELSCADVNHGQVTSSCNGAIVGHFHNEDSSDLANYPTGFPRGTCFRRILLKSPAMHHKHISCNILNASNAP
jgi:hypothetical protein